MFTRVLLCLMIFLALHQCALDYSVQKKDGSSKNSIRLRTLQESASKVYSNRIRKRSPCHRDSLHVEFADLGWDNWIIAPLSYNAYTCKGFCDYPLSDSYYPTNHATVQSMVHSIHPKVPQACCVPIKYKSLTILHTNKTGQPVLRAYKNMIVEACGCR